MNKNDFSRRTLLKKFGTSSSVGALVTTGVATASPGHDRGAQQDENDEPDIVIINNSAERGEVEVKIENDNRVSLVGKIPTKGLNSPVISDLPVSERVNEARKEIQTVSTEDTGEMELEAKFRGETTTSKIYVSENGLGKHDTVLIQVDPSRGLLVRTTISCEK